MRRQHQVVALAAPGHMVAESASVGSLTVFPLDRYIFVKSGHSLPPLGNAFYASLRVNPKKTSAMIEIPGRNYPVLGRGRLRHPPRVPPSAFSVAPLLRGEFVFCLLRSVSSVFISGRFVPWPISGIVTDQEIQGAGTDFRPTLRSKLKGFPHENHV